MLKIQNIEFSYPHKQVLFKANHLELKKGELVALIGSNGSGKSSLIKAISGLERLRTGDIFLDSVNIRSIRTKELAKKLSLVLTDAPYPHLMPLYEFVSFGRYPFNNWLARISESDLKGIQNAIQACGLDGMQDKLMGELSDGERQRAMVARTLAQETDLIILDEPTTHLDGINTIQVLKLLRKQSNELNKSILFSTHKVIESLQLADRLWVIWQGRIVEMSVEDFGKDGELQRSLLGEHFYYERESGKFSFSIPNRE